MFWEMNLRRRILKWLSSRQRSTKQMSPSRSFNRSTMLSSNSLLLLRDRLIKRRRECWQSRLRNWLKLSNSSNSKNSRRQRGLRWIRWKHNLPCCRISWLIVKDKNKQACSKLLRHKIPSQPPRTSTLIILRRQNRIRCRSEQRRVWTHPTMVNLELQTKEAVTQARLSSHNRNQRVQEQSLKDLRMRGVSWSPPDATPTTIHWSKRWTDRLPQHRLD